MIKNLTKEQESKIPEYVQNALNKGLSTKRLDVSVTENQIYWIYETFLKDHSGKPKVFITESPYSALVLAAKLPFILNNKPIPDEKAIKELIKDQFNNRLSLSYWWMGFYTFYKFINKELLPDIKIEHFDKMLELVDNLSFILPNKDYCVVSQPPTEIHRKGTVLHNENGKALKYSDNTGLYSLNGIRLEEKWVITPAKDISVSDVMKEQNVDVRREVLRKIGLERFIKETKGKCLDSFKMTVNNKECEYKLLEVTFEEGVTARVLKMDNPSIDAIHVEGVEDTCNTVKEALAWRNGFDKYIEPKQLT